MGQRERGFENSPGVLSPGKGPLWLPQGLCPHNGAKQAQHPGSMRARLQRYELGYK